MRVLLSFRGVNKLVDLEISSWDLPLGDVVEAAFGHLPASKIWVNHEPFDPQTALSIVSPLEGATISDEPRPSVQDSSGWVIRLSAGSDVSFPISLKEGQLFTVGRSPQSDLQIDSPSTSWGHATFLVEGGDLRITDLDSSNGTFIGSKRSDSGGQVLTEGSATVVVGGAALTFSRGLGEPSAPPPGSLPNVTQARTAPFNRPPRAGLPTEPEAIVPPSKNTPTKGSPFSWAAILSPLIMAGVMVAVMGNMRFAVFALLSPVIAIGTWLESRNRFKRQTAEEDERFSEAMEKFEEELTAVADEERRIAYEYAPDPGAALIRSALPSTRLWQRRFGAADFLKLHVGLGAQNWTPKLDSSASVKLEDSTQKMVDEARVENCPIEVDLSNAGVVGIYGERETALGVARSLVAQAATHHGPADLSIGIFADSDRSAVWEWAGWLPHTDLHAHDQQQWLGFATRRSEALLSSLRDSIDGQLAQAFMLVVDSDILLEGRESVVRELLGHGRLKSGERSSNREVPVSGIVIADSEDQLPATCTTVIEVRADSAGAVKRPEIRESVEDVLLAQMSERSALFVSQNLAHFDDPELKLPGATLPSLVPMLPLLGLEQLDGEAITKLWRTSRGFSTPVGRSESGVYSLDLVRDGPHGLVGGTTGSGKSEFLRSMVAGLAARVDPEHLTFILIDFKGGAAFAACEDLPHTIGTISNLDEQLANRAIKALEAEMRFRQEAFAAAGEGVDNLDAYLATNPAEPMPRLLVVIDEFAQLAKDFPDVLTSLVSVAAVGRTLGVHMILATQRPAGVVNDDILANTNMRVALRVQSREDSTNVIGVPAASTISREQRGRAYVKLGEDDITPIQTALVTGFSEASDQQPLVVNDLIFGVDPAPRPAPRPPKGAMNDLDKLIEAVNEANELAGFAPPRPVWPEALGERVDLQLGTSAELDASNTIPEQPSVGRVEDKRVLVALADEPDRQRQFADGWDLAEGNLLLIGIPGSGTTTALASIALTLADHMSPEDLDLFVIDMGASEDLLRLQDLPHMSGYAGSGPGGQELLSRLISYLRQEVARRKANPKSGPTTVVLLDGLATLREEFQDYQGSQLIEDLYRVYADGPSVGVHWAVATTRGRAVPGQMDDVTTQKWMFRLADPYDYTLVGVQKSDIPPAVPGRAVFATTKLQAHVATPAKGVADAVASVRSKWEHASKKAPMLALLPDRVWAEDLAVDGNISGEPWRIPVGIAESNLQPTAVELYQGEHMLVAGPVRSGKSSVLMGIAHTLRKTADKAGQNLELWGLGSRRSPVHDAGLDRSATFDEAAEFFVSARIQSVPTAIFVDDAEQYDDADGLIEQLLGSAPHIHMFVAGRSDDLRSMYSHWTKKIRRARCGILLQPNVDTDGELLGVRLPRRAPVEMTRGRGYSVMQGEAVLGQFATFEQG